MTTFVLVHGAMHGGWCWRDVRRILTDRGHEVFTPTLTGQGDRHHLLTREVGVANHVDDLAELVHFEDLHDVVLVLHSYAGVLARPLAQRVGDRLAAIIYAGAFLTRPGECLLDVEPPETSARYRQLVEQDGDGWRVPASDAFLTQWGLTDPALRAWVGPRLTDFPARALTDPTSFDAADLAAVPQAYLRHTDPPLPSLDASEARAVAAGWPMRELATGHDLMVVAPGPTADLLEELAGLGRTATDR
jgi:pimeloyl-ACP methyl ester carboxylesterase